MYINEPHAGCFVVGFVCPACDQIADTQVGDLAVDREANVRRRSRAPAPQKLARYTAECLDSDLLRMLVIKIAE